MRDIIKNIRTGLGYIPEFGSHPGTEFYVLFVVGTLLIGGWKAALFIAFMLGIPYFYGAYDRGADYKRILEKRSQQKKE